MPPSCHRGKPAHIALLNTHCYHFDVYENPSQQTRTAYPYILDIQHALIADLATRIVVALGNVELLKNKELKNKVLTNEELTGLTLKVEFEGTQLLVLTPQITSMSKKVYAILWHLISFAK
ncbi:MAG: toxin CcdB [Motiliproteus sp.]|jgi:toxin CcdB